MGERESTLRWKEFALRKGRASREGRLTFRGFFATRSSERIDPFGGFLAKDYVAHSA